MEDDFRVAKINQEFVGKIEGFEVVGVAPTIQDAKEILTYINPDLVLLDVYFPDGNGLDMLRYIRKQNLSTDVILITAEKELYSIQEALRGGVIDYMIKPVMFDRFKQTLEQYAEYRKQLQTIDDVNQNKVDQLVNTVRGRKAEEREQNIPKGIDPLTLEKIKNEMSNYGNTGVTAEYFSQMVGISRTTARRYLEHMVSTDYLTAELSYGQVGRPERLYRKKK